MPFTNLTFFLGFRHSRCLRSDVTGRRVRQNRVRNPQRPSHVTFRHQTESQETLGRHVRDLWRSREQFPVDLFRRR